MKDVIHREMRGRGHPSAPVWLVAPGWPLDAVFVRAFRPERPLQAAWRTARESAVADGARR